jgi:hypothetical protein
LSHGAASTLGSHAQVAREVLVVAAAPLEKSYIGIANGPVIVAPPFCKALCNVAALGSTATDS